MKFGSQSVVVQVVTEDLNNRDENGQPAIVKTPVTVRGCRVRPLPAREVNTDNGNRVTDSHRITAPCVPAVVNLRPNDEIVFEGNTYEISLSRVFPDLNGRPHKATIEISRNLG